MTERETIMICDDNATNLSLLDDLLTGAGYHTIAFPRGDLALAAIDRHPPDLILLDIMMPKPDGYEVCRRLKTSPTRSDIPIIFISALESEIDKVRAFQAGGVDYVTKPVRREEVLARVEVHLKLRRQQRAITSQNEALKQQNVELEALERQRDELVHLVVHDLRTPLTGIIMATQLMQRELEPATGATPPVHRRLSNMLKCAQEMRELINTILDIQSMENACVPLTINTLSMAELVEDALETIGCLAEEYTIMTEVESGLQDAVLADTSLTKRVIINLLANALNFAGTERRVSVRITAEGPMTRLAIDDRGPGVPLVDRARIFDKYQQGDASGEQPRGNGLGLAFCKLAITQQGGRIGVEDRPGGGSRFWFTLPAAPSDGRDHGKRTTTSP